MSETAAERALMAERHDDGDGRNATWHMSVNRMGSMLAAIRNEARAEALREAAKFMVHTPIVDRIEAEARPALDVATLAKALVAARNVHEDLLATPTAEAIVIAREYAAIDAAQEDDGG